MVFKGLQAYVISKKIDFILLSRPTLGLIGIAAVAEKASQPLNVKA